MPRLNILLVLLCLFLSGTAKSERVELSSPDGSIKAIIELGDKIHYSVYYNGEQLLKDCWLRMELRDGILGADPKLLSKKTNAVKEVLRREIPFKNAGVKNEYNSLRLNFKGNYAVEFRAFDDGVAYRFITDRKKDIEVMNEDFVINFPQSYLAHLSCPAGFKTSYEYPYSHIQTADYKASDRMCYLPVLLEAKNPYKILISEADLYDYPCMFLKSTGNNGLESLFPKCPLEAEDEGDRSQKILKEADYIARTSGKRSFPWRFFLLTERDAQIVENDMVYKLSSPNVIGDVAWIKPGQVSWEWWHDACLYGVDFKSGYNMDSYKYYIDFASKFGIPYIIMDEGWAASTRDPYTPNPTINLPELIKYGESKNVKIVLWLTWLTVEKNMDLFRTFSDWGIAGAKIDFMDRSDQWMVNYYERVAKEAAKYKIMVDFHGSFKPAGLERKYPNVISYEGVLGQEQCERATPENTIYHPFIRNAVGPMDFTPGAMLNTHPETNRGTRVNQMGTGTRTNMMSMYVIFESGLQMFADNPANYYREPECMDFLTGIPVTWDETRGVAAKVGEYVVVAKRKGDVWYVGGMANQKAQQTEISFDFLPEGKDFTLTSYEDGVNADRQAMDYKKRTTKVNHRTKLVINMVRDGGWVGKIE